MSEVNYIGYYPTYYYYSPYPDYQYWYYPYGYYPQPYQYCPCCMNIWLAGIKEVVEWIENDSYLVDQRATNLGDIPVFLCHSERWQKKLKEWGCL